MSTCCSCGGPEFSSQSSHGGSQPAVTTVPGNPRPPSNLCEQQACVVTHAHACRQDTHINISIDKSFLKDLKAQASDVKLQGLNYNVSIKVRS